LDFQAGDFTFVPAIFAAGMTCDRDMKSAGTNKGTLWRLTALWRRQTAG
jgi:hypothetical protein